MILISKKPSTYVICVAFILNLVLVSSRTHYRTLHTLKNETEAIFPGGILNYHNGQLDSIPATYKEILTSSVEVNCNYPGVYNHISQSASCPWEFVLNTDVNRDPPELYEAKCRTNRCLGTNMNGCLRHKCEEVKYFTWVKRRNGVGSFTRVLEPISVGCTCSCQRMSRNYFAMHRATMCS